MSSLYDEYTIDSSLENDGTWVEVRAGLKVKIRAETSIKVRKVAAKIAKKNRAAILANGGQLTPELEDKTAVELCADAIVVDWQGAVDREGTVLPFTRKNVIQLLTDLPALRREIQYVARTEESFKVEGAEEMTENSQAPSGQISA